MNNIKIFSAFHKEFELPEQVDGKNIYIPVHVGKVLSKLELDIMGDNTGDNISFKNPNYCELTMLYWMWKNYNFSDTDYIGLSHYRRLFKLNKKIINKISKYDIVLPKKANYGSIVFPVWSLRHHYYYHHHIMEDFDVMYSNILKLYPEYTQASYVLRKIRPFIFNKAYFFNMFIFKKEIFYEYCEWLFAILEECEKDIIPSCHINQARVFGFLGERLLNVFIEKKKKEGLKIIELPLIFK